MKRVTIIGGGYAGTALARALDSAAEVRLIEARDCFVHNVGAIRAVTDPSLLARIILPYDRLLQRGTVVRGRAAEVTEQGVMLADGTAIESDVVIVATGSHYAQPFKPQDEATANFTAASRAASETLRAAARIAIVGGGAVGTELAGEIVSRFPEKAVTLVTATPTLLHGYPRKLSESLQAQLRARGVDLRTGVEVRNLADAAAPFAGPLVTSGGIIDADLVFPALGARPLNDLLRALPGATVDKTGRIVMDKWLRPMGSPNIFALGDAAATGDAMTIVAITRQVPWLVKTLKALIGGRRVDSQPAYTPWTKLVILVPLGPSDDASVLPLGSGMTFGRRTTALLKGKDLFIPRYRRQFRLASN